MADGASDQAQPLHRQVGALGVLFLTMSALSPSASVYVAGASAVHSAGTGAAIGFLAGGIISALMALLYAELAASFPHAGGPYGSVSGALGSRAGFVVQALLLVTSPAFLAFTGLGFADYVHFLAPGFSALSICLAAIVLAAVVAILNLKTNAWITGTFLAVEMLAVIILSVVSLTHPARPLSEALFHPVTLGKNGIEPASAVSVALAVVAGAWACAGANWAMYFGEELHDAPKRIGGVVAMAGALASILIAAPIVLFTTSASDLPKILASDSPLATFLAATAGPIWGKIVSLGVAVAIFNSMIVATVAASRFFYANGRDGIFPAPVNRVLTRVHGRLLSPWLATLILGALGILFALMGERMNILLLSGENFSVSLVAFGVLFGRRLGRTGKSGFRTPWYPVVPLLGVLATLGMIAATYADADAGRPSMMILSGVVVLAAIYYQFALRPRGWRVHVPAQTEAREPAPQGNIL
jgi:amino acid transporter